MVEEQKTQLRLEIGHVLFIDIVGYSKLLIDQQSELLRDLNEVVSGTKQFRDADAQGKLIRLPTGDGMALVFRNNPEAAAQCAMEISQARKTHPKIQLRMGVHSGPVNELADVNQRANIAGAGINIAQRVMDCGDAGHILLSKHVAEDLEHYDRWRPFLHDLGTCEVKHGLRLGVVSLYGDEIGNPQLPRKFALNKHRDRMRWAGLAIGLVLVSVIVAAFFLMSRRPTPTHSTSAIPEKSIAVLPFENLSSEKENAYFTDGVQDEILTDLAKIADLKVISRTSVMQYKSGAPRNLREIGQQLGVAHLLEGSVQRAANKVRVNAQLIDARTDGHQWAENYDRPLDDVFVIQSEIAKAIADQLQAKLSSGEKAAIEQPPTTDLVANGLYVQARELSLRTESQKENLLKAVPLLEQAVARDPHFALAYCLMGRVHLMLFWGGYDHAPARRELANAALQNALRLQPNSGEVHLALAAYAYQGFRDYDRARAELDIARRALPNDTSVYLWSGAIDRRQGRWEEAVRNFTRSAELDPRNPEPWDAAGSTYNGLRRYGEARQMAQRVVELTPHDYFARIILALQAMDERADIRPLRTQLDAIVAEAPGAAEQVADVLFRCAVYERDPAAANISLAAISAKGISATGNFVYPKEWFAAVRARVFSDNAAARAAFAAAREVADKLQHDQPDYAPAWSLLGRIDAALGHKDDAIREGRRACELMPVSQDAFSGPAMITHLAVIYAWTGEKASALEELTKSAQLPAGISYGELKLAPELDPLRGDPRFDQIVASLSPKG